MNLTEAVSMYSKSRLISVTFSGFFRYFLIHSLIGLKKTLGSFVMEHPLKLSFPFEHITLSVLLVGCIINSSMPDYLNPDFLNVLKINEFKDIEEYFMINVIISVMTLTKYTLNVIFYQNNTFFSNIKHVKKFNLPIKYIQPKYLLINQISTIKRNQ